MKTLIKNKTYRRILFGVIAIVGLIVAIYSFSAARNGDFLLANIANNSSGAAKPVLGKESVVVQTKKISLENITQSVSASAVTEPLNIVKVSPKMTGKVVGVYFKEGDWVNAGQTIIQLEQDQALRTAYNNAQTNLINTRASMNQDIKAAEVAVEAAKVALANARKSLNNTGAATEQAVIDAYTNALNNARAAVLTGTNAIIAATELQYKYFGTGNDQDAIRIAEKKSKAIRLLLGKSNAGRWTSQFIIPLNGGVKGLIEDATANFSQEKIDQILTDIVPALQSVKDLLTEVRTDLDWKHGVLPSEKNALDTARIGIESSITGLSNSRQAVINAKLGKTTRNDAAQSAYESAKKQLESAEANLASIKKRAKLQIAAAQGQLDSVQAQLDNTTITAPISGIVSRKYIETGEMAIAGSPAVEIVNTSGIKIELSLTEFDIGKIFIGQEAEIKLAAYPDEKFIGKVYYVGSVADPASKKFPVKIQLENGDGRIKAGMVADVKIITNRQKNVLVIPKSAVFKEEGVEKVYVAENSKVKIKTVKTEVVDENRLKVAEGLSAGEEIIINGNYNLKEGDLVIIKNQ
ncbi:MAG TPA: efflux RND transporter periplasmic adaptor subunit [Candidatus Parcubacteria bacterium]|nr:efflux RND transporter periplasmic adaptor subunit [Candidatus Parcubacteria bacterium]